MSALKTACVITNYNYGRYLDDCLTSVFKQSMPFDQVILIDDGSSDNSRQIIDAYQSKCPNLSVVIQENSGQLSGFNKAIKYIPENSQVFFLDADDAYAHDYVELLMASIGNKLTDFTFCEVLRVKSQSFHQIATAKKNNVPNQVFERTSALTRCREYWIGKETSALSMSDKALRMILPYPYEREWKIRADDVLVFASSLIGFAKVYIPSVHVLYRVHESNNHYGKKLSDYDNLLRDRNKQILFKWYCDKYLLSVKPSPLEMYKELKGLSSENKAYLQIRSKVKMYRKVIKHYVKYKLRRAVGIRP